MKQNKVISFNYWLNKLKEQSIWLTGPRVIVLEVINEQEVVNALRQNIRKGINSLNQNFFEQTSSFAYLK
uniref:Bm14363, isoform b n=1 Tax=Brugia malayi TaxID=6279 RepID=A0A1I9G5Y2_BRUMA|nr:Bm14363, isoform b [Brugia malayi]